MKKNIGSIDKVIRILVAVLILTLAFTKVLTGTVAIVAFILAAVFILTSLVSFCPLYLPFGLSTNKKK